MSTLGYHAPWFCEEPQDSAWGSYENSGMHFVDQPTDAYSVNGLNSESNYGSDMSFMKFALDVSLDLNPKSVIDYLTSPNQPLYADVAPIHLRNNAPSELDNPTPTYIGVAPTADLRQPFMQPLLTGSEPVMYATRPRQNEFFTAAESTPIGFTDQQQQVESTSASDQVPASFAAPSFFETQNPMVPNSSLLSPNPTHVKDKKEPLHVCHVKGCGQLFKIRASLQKHLRRHSMSSYCGENFVNNWTFEKHEKKYACGICKKTFTRYESFHDHMTTHSGEKEFACEICDKGFAHNGYLKKHMQVHVEEKKNKSKDLKVRAGNKTFACKICGKTFARAPYLRQHMITHDEEKKFECDVCRKRFSNKLHVGVHMAVHTKEKRFACDICDMRFSQKATLTRHKAVHTGQKKFTCGVCNRDIARYDNLKVHMRTHEKVVDTQF